ncbi:MAG: Sir2 family NAD-dependent protein deacetylase [Deltaproteobacteria bacterium]|nr:Sir2 family NAD-dependent protein deacetylase [Deltaproteobacteria bacterium]
MNNKIDRLITLIRETDKIVIFTGAGVSTESGIPDFRSPGGVWSRFDPADFTIERYLKSPEARDKQWQFLLANPELRLAQPNPAHIGIAKLEAMGKVLGVITQNIDGLHQKAGSTPRMVHELHGTLERIICLNCSAKFITNEVLAQHGACQHLPACDACGGMLKPDVVLFGEALPPLPLKTATQLSFAAELLLVVGSSLVVYPAASIPFHAKRNGAKVAIINLGETAFDDGADVVINDYASKVMTTIGESLEGC